MGPIFKILLAEDDEGIREAIFEILVEEGHEVTVARDGEDALTCLERKKFDLIMTDYKMPKMTGTQLIEWCKKHSVKSQVVFMTANMKALLLDDVIKKFPAKIIEKPMTLDDILDAVKFAQDNRKEAFSKFIQKNSLDMKYA
ncbi:response regulator receiver domain-containing protein [Bacteriovorax stolpii]|nr:response regulator [Bacteriovorax stolpii]TDP50949.1 response regulator receiver domain-containing protein [Bacteriovorax stolpii]